MRLLVCGGRDYRDMKKALAAIDAAHKKTAITVIVHGGASGADAMAFPGGRGTADMVKRLQAASVPVWRPYG